MNATSVEHFLDSPEDEQRSMMQSLTDQQLKELSKTVNRIRDDMYERGSSTPKYGNLRRSMYLDELKKLFDAAPNFGIKVSFVIQLFYALRVGELKHIEHQRSTTDNAPDMLKIRNEKCKRNDWIPIHGPTKNLMKYLPDIRSYGTDYLRKRFGDMREEAGLTNTYDKATDGRPLYQFTTHSLRKTAITQFTNEVENHLNVKTFVRPRSRCYDEIL